MNTWQTVYEQLQEMLNKCIELWLYLDWCNFTVEYVYFNNRQLVVCNDMEWQESESIHWLFSKDSGIMEFIEWRIWDVLDNYLEMADKTAEEKVIRFVNNAIIPTK